MKTIPSVDGMPMKVGETTEKKIERYEKALTFYADIRAYMFRPDLNKPFSNQRPAVISDSGTIARKALKGDL